MTRMSAFPLVVYLLLMVAIVHGRAQEDFSRIIAIKRQANDPVSYELDLYGESKPPRYRYPQEVDQNEIGFMSPDDEYILGELEYGNNKGPDVMMEQVYPGDYVPKNRNKTFKKVIYDIIDDNDIDIPADGAKKRFLSSFRERMENEKSKIQREKLAEQFLKQLENEAEERDAEMEYDANREYMETLRDKGKYKNSVSSTYSGKEHEPRVFMSEIMRKRQLPEYTSLGWSGVGYRKRESPANYAFANEALYRSMENEDDERPRFRRYEWIKASQQGGSDEPDEMEYSRPLYSQEYMYAKRKRNAVTKRSSNYYTMHHKRLANKEQYRKKFVKKEHVSGTDPKIVKDLKNIFGTKDNNNKTEAKLNKKSNLDKKATKRNEKIESKKSSTAEADEKTTAVTTAATLEHQHENDKKKRTQDSEVNNQKKSVDERLNIKKKSLDWSNYFGYDRRKKSRQNLNDIDDEWLMDRYNKAFASAAKKSTEYPLKFFRNHDELKRNSDDADDEEARKKKNTDQQSTNESKLEEMDVKLKNIEDLIIDEALKYTGAHEGTTDSNEIQEIKDKVISRLAAAYSLEKMRRALGEFKTSIAAQRYAMKFNEEPDKESDSEMDMQLEEKKRDNPDEKRESRDKKFQEEKKEDCRSENELDAEDQGSELTNSVSGINDYEILERRCRSVARSVAAGEQSDFFYPLCKWHQICYLCSPDDSQEALTNCDMMFLSKAYVLCQGDLVCQWAARPAVEYLRDAYETSEPTKPLDKAVCQTDSPFNSEYSDHLGFKSR